ncbi:hypothetical protein BHE74_00028227 [Ensete ventricosum]|nr:hypothetical protein BHE74_00028227 [Ensete ventricosum]
MSRGPASNNKYSYNHLNAKGPSEAIDVHDITVKKSRLRIFLSYFGAAVFLTATFYLVALKELCISSIWIILVCFSLAKVLHHKPVKKGEVSESFICLFGLFFFFSFDVLYTSFMLELVNLHEQ